MNKKSKKLVVSCAKFKNKVLWCGWREFFLRFLSKDVFVIIC